MIAQCLLTLPALMAWTSLTLSSAVQAVPHPIVAAKPPHHVATRQDAGYTQPESWLTVIPNSNLGEPINVVISSASDKAVLSDSGLQSYFSSLFFSPNNCLGITLGDQQAANLNDGQGTKNQSALYRYNFDAGTLTCQESVNGGQHFRWWRQSTTGAIFMAASVEMGAQANHMVVDNGYNLGRDWLVGNATNSSGTTSPQDSSHFTAKQSSVTVNVDQSSINHGISFDDQVVVLTVTQTKSGNGTSPTASSSSSSSSSSSGSSSSADTMHSPPWLLAGSLALLTAAGLTLGGSSDLPQSTSRKQRGEGLISSLAYKVGGQKLQLPLPPALGERMSNQSAVPIDDETRARVTAAMPFAAAAYCRGPGRGTWGGPECGPSCNAVPGDVDMLWYTGDGDWNPHRFLAYVNDSQTLVLAVEGSASKVLSAVNDINWIPLPIPASSPVAAALHKYAASPSEIKETLGVVHAEGPSYPLGSPWSGILTVHEGFYDAWQRIYPQELDAIRQALRGKYAGKVKTLLVTGHSLGAGIATLDALALRHDLGDDFVKMDHVVFGSPRMWNPVAARIFDQIVANEDAGIYYRHVHHANDLVPQLPLVIEGYQHPSNEIFLPDNTTAALACPGQENLHCSLSRGIGDAFLKLNTHDHAGMYFGSIFMSRSEHALQCFQADDYVKAGVPIPGATLLHSWTNSTLKASGLPADDGATIFGLHIDDALPLGDAPSTIGGLIGLKDGGPPAPTFKRGKDVL